MGGFWLSHGDATAAEHGGEEHAPAKPADSKPPEPPLPPRPTEYPRGLTEKRKPGEAAPVAVAPSAKPEEHVATAGDSHAPAAAHDPEAQTAAHDAAAHAAPGDSKPEIQAQPKDAAKPVGGETKLPRPAEPKPDAAAKFSAWQPPKRYHFVTDPYTGLAMDGIDPVQIFVDGAVEPGLRDNETDWGGATWHFTNEGNLAAFQHDPDVYAPKFGGRCAFALSQGLLVEAQPRFYVLYREHLYLFANAANRAAFLTNPDAYSMEAERQWPILSRGQP